MHEFSLIADLISKIESVAIEHKAARVVDVRVRLGALAHISGDHLREHFVHSTIGTIAEGARLTIDEQTDVADPHAQDILLESVEFEE